MVDSIYLNPVRAKIVPPENVRQFRWSSLPGIVRGDGWTDDRGWRGNGRYGDDDTGRKRHERAIIELGQDEARWESLGLKNLSVGWAIGTGGWRQSTAKEFRQLALEPSLESAEVRGMREAAWEESMQAALAAAKRTGANLVSAAPKLPWKLTIAAQVRSQSGAPWPWLAERLRLGSPGALRTHFCREAKRRTL